MIVVLSVVSASLSKGQVIDRQIVAPSGPIEIEADEVTHDREQNQNKQSNDEGRSLLIFNS